MLLRHYGLPVIVAVNRSGSDAEREVEMLRKHLGGQGVEALVREHFAKGSNLANSMVELIDEKPGSYATTPTRARRNTGPSRRVRLEPQRSPVTMDRATRRRARRPRSSESES